MSLFGKPPWYAGGLAFACQQCGRCCAGPDEGYVWINDAELERLAKFLGQSVEAARKQYTRAVSGRRTILEHPVTHDCLFLEPFAGGPGKGCAIYDIRPAQCRTWPFWRSNLASPDSWARAGLRCPGINRGDRFDLAEILLRRDASEA